MSQQVSDVHQTIATADSPAVPFTDLSRERRREVFFALPDPVRAALVGDMTPEQLESFIRVLDPDEATDVLGYADEAVRESVLAAVDSARREKIDFLLSFNPESAAGLMDLDYVTVAAERSVAEVAQRVRRFEERTGRFPTIFVTENGTLLGELPGATLSMTDHETESITDYVQSVPQVRYDRADEEVLDVLCTNRERTVAVLDEDDETLG